MMGRFWNSFYFMCLCGIFVCFASASYAQCSSPSGVAGEMGYNITGNAEMEYCNGGNWIPMNSNSSGATLIGHWTLDETSGSSIADSVGSGTGTWSDGADDDVSGETGSGQIGSALTFDGNDDYIQISDSAVYDLTSSVSISAWFRHSAGNGGILCKQNATTSNNANYCLYISNAGTYSFSVGDGTGAQYAESAVTPDFEWHHFVGVADGANITLYLDGAQIYQVAQTRSLTATSVDLYMGTWRSGQADSSTNAEIDDVRLYDGALTLSEVQDLYLIDTKTGHWRFDETSGTTASDSSHSANNGTMSGGLNASSDSVDGQVGMALAFDGNDYITAGASATNIDNIFLGGGTVSYWVYPENWGVFGRVIDKSDSGSYPPDSGWHSQGTSQQVIFAHAFSGGTGQWSVADGSVPLTTWTHVAITYDSSSSGNDPVFYINGSSVSVSEDSTPSGSAVSDAVNPITFGSRQGGAGNFFTGRIDDTRIFHTTLSASEIQGLYICRKSGGMFYNATDHVLQWCDVNAFVQDTGTAGSGGGGCGASGSLIAGGEGAMQYDTTNNKMVFCDGANWVNIPN
ncbi:MAG: LamG domain-containing protein [Alphaproteobacteria bacterium]